MSTDPAGSALLRRWGPPLGLFLALMLAYHANGSHSVVRDARSNLYLPVALLQHGSLSFDREEYPFMFGWQLRTPLGLRFVEIRDWNQTMDGRPAHELLKSGAIVPAAPLYFMLPTVREGRFVGIYGPGAGLSSLPFFAALSLVKKDWKDDSAILGREGKFFSSLCVAASAVVLYFIFLPGVGQIAALGFAVLYGLGTCTWAEVSQTLWQQSPTLLYLSLGLFFLLRAPATLRNDALTGLCFGAATLCRPTLVVVLIAAGVVVLRRDRKGALLLSAGAFLPLLALALYNHTFFGSPLKMGQSQAAAKLAEQLTGSSDIWQTPLFEGAAGILFSPSRGLLIFSPFFAFSFWGLVRSWKHEEPIVFRALGSAFLMLLATASKWFEWFGGWSYGYRIISELTPLLMVLLLPVVEPLLKKPGLRIAVVALGVTAVLIQAVGAFLYVPELWNARTAYEIFSPDRSRSAVVLSKEQAQKLAASGQASEVKTIMLDVNQPRFQPRLWSWSDSQFGYFLRPGAWEESRETQADRIRITGLERWGPPPK